jgi:hypothetical protein
MQQSSWRTISGFAALGWLVVDIHTSSDDHAGETSV